MRTIAYFLFVFLPFIVGCSSMYIPSPKPTPLFASKGEAQVEIGTSINSPFITGGYAFSEKYALIASGSLSYRNFMNVYERPYVEFDILPFPDGAFAHRAVELGIGRYDMLSSSRHKMELFAGVAYGNANEDKVRNSYYQCFLQANTGNRNKHFEIGGAFRLAFSWFDYLGPAYYPTGYRREDMHQKFGAAHIEPLFFMKFGGENLKGSFRAGGNLALPFNFSNSYVDDWYNRSGFWEYTIFHLSLGLSYRFR